MKSLLVSVLCGVAYCYVLPARNCSKEELLMCSEDSGCRRSNCLLELYGRCGTEVFPDNFPEENYGKIVDIICIKTIPLRKKYLKTVEIACMRRALFRNRHLFENCGVRGMNITGEESCRDIPVGLRCVVNFLTKECDQDTTDYYRIPDSGYVVP